MSPKGRWGKKDSKAETKVAQVLPVRRTDLELQDAVCVQIENYYTIEECERYMEVLQNGLDWKKQDITVSKLDGRLIEGIEPRLTLFMADRGVRYEYSGRDNEGVEWHPAILEIKEKAERALVECGLPRIAFNSVQLNRYDGPRHSLGMHADNEPDLVRGAPIASVTFGASREFRIMRRDDESKNWVLNLADGCFLLMGGDMQTHYLHGVPPGGEKSVRINLTFRLCHPRDEARTEALAEAKLAKGEAIEKGSSWRGASGYRKGRGKSSEPGEGVNGVKGQDARADGIHGKGRGKVTDSRQGSQPERSDREDAW